MKIYRAGPRRCRPPTARSTTEIPLAMTVSTTTLSKFVLAAETTTPARRRPPTTSRSPPGHLRQHDPAVHRDQELRLLAPWRARPATSPTVTDAEGNAIAFGTATPIEFVAGVATAVGALNGEMRLYKSASAARQRSPKARSPRTLTSFPPPRAAAKFTIGSSAATLPPAGQLEPDDDRPGRLREHGHLLRGHEEPYLLRRLGEPERQRADGRRQRRRRDRLRLRNRDHLHQRRRRRRPRPKTVSSASSAPASRRSPSPTARSPRSPRSTSP